MNPNETFIVTAASADAARHRERTISSPVPVSEIATFDRPAAAELQRLGRTEVRCWGSQPGPSNLRSWDRMAVGHLGLLYTGQGQFPFALPLIHKSRSRPLAEHLWGVGNDGQTWELMFYFDTPIAVDLSTDDVRASLGYDDKWWPQGLQYPTVEHQEALLEKFGSLSAFVAAGTANGHVGTTTSNGTIATPEELLLGGTFSGVPENPPKAPQKKTEHDPLVAGRGYLAHEATVGELADHVGANFRTGTPGINHDGAWAAAGSFHIAEVKSVTAINEVHQLQRGLGQILHNCFKAGQHGIDNIQGYLVAEREPANSRLWRDLCADVGIVFTWPERFVQDVPRPNEAP